MKKRVLFAILFIIIAILVSGTVCTFAQTYQAATYRYGYYEISNADQLYWFAQQVNSGNNSINGRLVSNITLNAGDVFGSSRDYENTKFTKWKAIGDHQNPYMGIFDGNGYTISGLYFYCSNYTSANEYGQYGSLFYKVSGKVHDLNIENSYFYHYNYASAICGFNSGVIENCNVKASVQGNYRSGIAYQNTGEIKDCDFSGLLFGIGSTKNYNGGICYDNGGKISNCTNTSDILDGGGICSNNAGTVENCKNYGELINGYGSYLGGICSYNTGTVSGCVNEGRITSSQLTTISYAGGICGTNAGIIERCANLANISYYQGYVGGICGENLGNSLGSNVVKDCYNAGRVESASPKACGGIVGRNYANVVGCYHRTGNIYVTGESYTGTICGINGYNSSASYYKGVIKNCIDFWYHDGYQIGQSQSGSVSQNVYPSRYLYDTNAAYFLNCYSSDDDVSWYQNVDNGQEEDPYPVLDSSHGKVYSNNSNNPPGSDLPENLIAQGKGTYVSWTLDINGLLSVTATSGGSGYTAYTSPWYSYRDKILSVVIDGSETQVLDYSFFDCTNLKSVKLSNNIDSVGIRAFAGCTALKSIYINDGKVGCNIKDYAFYGCTSLEEISFDIKTTVGDCAFDGCTSLHSIYINSSDMYGEITVGEDSFDDVVATMYYPRSSYIYPLADSIAENITLQSADFGTCGSDVRWSFDANNGVLTLCGSGYTTKYSAGNYAPWGKFQNAITKIVVEEGISELAEYIFEFCSFAEEIILPNTLKSMAYNAFNDCKKINNLILPSSLENFGNSWYGFNRCDNLTDVYYVGTKEEFELISGYNYATQNGVKMHYLVWNESTITCTQSGVEGHYCFDDTSVYDTKYDKDKNVKTDLGIVPASGHNMVWKEETAANCHETGIREHWKCTNCNTAFEDQLGNAEKTDIIIEIDPNNHHGDTEIRDETDDFAGNAYCLGCGQIIVTEKLVERIEIIGDDVTFGQSVYTAIVYPEDAANKEVVWSLNPEAFSWVDENGIVYPAITEMVTLTATAKDGSGVSASKEIIAAILVESIEIEGEDTISAPCCYWANVYPSYAAQRDVYWSVDDETIATIDQNGLVTPMGSGQIVITATSTDGTNIVATKVVNVIKLVERIEIEGLDFVTGDTYYTAVVYPENATDKSVTWMIADESPIAAIFGDGCLTFFESGTVKIIAYALDGSGVYGEKIVEGKIYATDIHINGRVSISQPTQYSVSINPGAAENQTIIWSVSDESIATVDENGLLTPVGNGVVELRAQTTDGSGVYAIKSITVTKSAHLTRLSSSVGVLDKEFSLKDFEYTIYVPQSTKTVTLNTSARNGAIYINGNSASSITERRVTLAGDVTMVELEVKPTSSELTEGSKYTITIVKGPLTITEVREDMLQFVVTPMYVDTGSLVVVAFYDGINVIGVQTAIFTDDSLIFDALENYTESKIMVLDSISNLKPLCKPEIVKHK